MSRDNQIQCGIIVSPDIENEVIILKKKLHDFRVVVFMEDSFKIEHAKAVIAEAYISESDKKYILLAAKTFNSISQNALLKLLEEPPRNICFIMIVQSKSVLLSTVRSRLPILKNSIQHKQISAEINFTKIDNEIIFAFLKANERLKKDEAKELLQALYFRATVVDKLILNKYQLECFEKGYQLLELNAQTQPILALVLMSFTVNRSAHESL